MMNGKYDLDDERPKKQDKTIFFRGNIKHHQKTSTNPEDNFQL